MKKVIILLFISTKLFTQDFSSYGLFIIESKIEGNINQITLNDKDGQTILLTYSNELNPRQLELIDTTYKALLTWEEIELKECRIIFENGKMSIIIIPESILYKDIDLSQFMPSGIQFYYKNFFEYDFRMFKDSLFMRLKGQYYSKEEFLEEIYNAAKDPILYIQIHDPSYLIRQIDLLREVNNQQEKELYELKDKLSELIQRHETLLNDHITLSEEKAVLENETEALTYGVIAINNKNLFGMLSKYDQKLVNRAIEIKSANNKLTLKEVATKLKSEGFKVSNKVLEAIFMIYFKEFPQNK